MKRRAFHSERGFGLLETIVALTLIASSGLALLSLINSSLETAIRIKDRDASARLKIMAAQAMSTINPLSTPEGKLTLATLDLTWKARPSGHLTRTAGFTGAATGQFEAQLYDADVFATDTQTRARVSFTMVLLGLKLREGMRNAGI